MLFFGGKLPDQHLACPFNSVLSSLLSQLLFHGSSRAALLAIMRGGLDMRKSCMGGTLGGGM
jgi:hypothetical protein